MYLYCLYCVCVCVYCICDWSEFKMVAFDNQINQESSGFLLFLNNLMINDQIYYLLVFHIIFNLQ